VDAGIEMAGHEGRISLVVVTSRTTSG
jgi:hypothetical protein